jgi:hypothetical protein
MDQCHRAHAALRRFLNAKACGRPPADRHGSLRRCLGCWPSSGINASSTEVMGISFAWSGKGGAAAAIEAARQLHRLWDGGGTDQPHHPYRTACQAALPPRSLRLIGAEHFTSRERHA